LPKSRNSAHHPAMLLAKERRARPRAIASFAAIIRLWPRYGDLAEDCGVEYQTVASWVRRCSIPHVYWDKIERSARQRRIHGITYDYLRSVAAHQARKG
jgi:hypothetical protein